MTTRMKPPFPADYTWRGCMAHDDVGYQSKCDDCVKDSMRGYSHSSLLACILSPRQLTRKTLLVHYDIPDVKIGQATEHMWGLRCECCNLDFHIALIPNFCPGCGVPFSEQRRFGERKDA